MLYDNITLILHNKKNQMLRPMLYLINLKLCSYIKKNQ